MNDRADDTYGNVITGHFSTTLNDDRPLKTGGGDSTSGGMEARIARLESDMDHVKTTLTDIKGDVKAARADIGQIKTDIAVIKASMPTKGFIFATSAGLLSAAGVLMAIIVRFLPAG